MAFAVFHLAFWRLFGWPRTLQTTTIANRAILQIANAQLVLVFAGVAWLCLAMSDVLAGMAAFWWLRLTLQFVWLRVHHRLVHGLSALFLLGALMFTTLAVHGLASG
nr:hypothetical protein [Luteimonas sp. RC10]